jgi:CheY-like chemotaxis protein
MASENVTHTGTPKGELLEKDNWVAGLHVIITDDSKANRKITRRLLESHGQRVTEAVDGLDCLRKIQELLNDRVVINAILMDNNMPNMSGMEATKALRARGYAGLIIGLTGDIMDADVTAFLDSGANEVLCKPLDLKKLNHLLHSDHARRGNSRTASI